MATFLPENTSTIEDFILAGRSVTLSYHTLSYKENLLNGTTISILNVVNDYMPEIKQVLVNVKLTDAQYAKYRYKPKLLCHDIYGNPELYYIILLINGIIDVKEFDFKTLKLLKVDHMNVLLSAIYNAERTYIDEYNSKHGT